MDLPEIDFTRIRPVGPASQREGFEQFVCGGWPTLCARPVWTHAD